MLPLQRILVATDYSTTANNALLYSLDLAEATSANVSILHACATPSAATANFPSGYYEAVSTEKDDKQAQDKMQQLKHDFLYDPQVEYDTIIRSGPAVGVIQQVAEDEKVDLIVMGTRRAEGMKTWLGSVTIDTVRESRIPVLVVPMGARYSTFQRIVLATTFTRVSDLNVLNLLKAFVQHFKAHLDVLHVHPSGQKYSSEQTHFREAFDHYLSGLSHQIHTVDREDISQGIQEFLNAHPTDMLVMLPQQRSFFEQLWHASQTKQMIFHTLIPLLTLRS